MAINTYNENNSYSTGTFVTYNSNLYVSVTDNNLGQTPSATADTAYWSLMSPSIRNYSTETTYTVNDFVLYNRKIFRGRISANKGNAPNINGDTVYWSLYNESRINNFTAATKTTNGTVHVPTNSGMILSPSGSLRLNTAGSRFLKVDPRTGAIQLQGVTSNQKTVNKIALSSHPGILSAAQVKKVNSIPDNMTISLGTKADSSVTLTGSNGIKIDNSTSGNLSKGRTISVDIASASNPGVVKTSNWNNQTGYLTTSAVTEKGLSDAFKSVVTVYPNTKPTPSADMGFAIYIKPAK
jgi:hypothetical protein